VDCWTEKSCLNFLCIGHRISVHWSRSLHCKHMSVTVNLLKLTSCMVMLFTSLSQLLINVHVLFHVKLLVQWIYILYHLCMLWHQKVLRSCWYWCVWHRKGSATYPARQNCSPDVTLLWMYSENQCLCKFLARRHSHESSTRRRYNTGRPVFTSIKRSLLFS